MNPNHSFSTLYPRHGASEIFYNEVRLPSAESPNNLFSNMNFVFCPSAIVLVHPKNNAEFEGSSLVVLDRISFSTGTVFL